MWQLWVLDSDHAQQIVQPCKAAVMSLQIENDACETDIKANAEIGGPGVATSFIIVAWITIFLSFFPAWDEAKKTWHELRCRRPTEGKRAYFDPAVLRSFSVPRRQRWFRRESQVQPDRAPPPQLRHSHTSDPEQQSGPEEDQAETEPRNTPSRRTMRNFSVADFSEEHRPPTRRQGMSRRTQKVIRLLGPVCDLQVVTSLGIVTAGVAEWGHLTFYHEQLVMLFYQLTLTSFWAARINYMSWDARENRWVLFVRRVAVLASCILGIVWQFYIFFRETAPGAWNDHGGPCYRFAERANSTMGFYFWIIGQVLFSVALTCSLWGGTRWINEMYFVATEMGALWLWERLQAVVARPTQQEAGGRGSRARRTSRQVGKGLAIAAVAFANLLYFLMMQLLAVWSYGDGFFPLTWLVYLCFQVWNTFDIMSLMILNRHMLEKEELYWGFGQILPLVLILSIIFSAVDTFCDSKPHEAESS